MTSILGRVITQRAPQNPNNLNNLFVDDLIGFMNPSGIIRLLQVRPTSLVEFCTMFLNPLSKGFVLQYLRQNDRKVQKKPFYHFYSLTIHDILNPG